MPRNDPTYCFPHEDAHEATLARVLLLGELPGGLNRFSCETVKVRIVRVSSLSIRVPLSGSFPDSSTCVPLVMISGCNER